MSDWNYIDWLEVAAMSAFYLLGMYNGYHKAKKKYRGY
jgi:hypothetical protein